jgi:hypothetical protein
MSDAINSESDTKPLLTPVPNEPWFVRGQDFLQRIADYSERQREKDPPTIIDFNNFPKTTQAFHTRLRIIEFIFCGSTAADHVSFSFGGRVFDFVIAVGTTIVPFAYEADLGIDITFTNVTSPDHLTYAYIIAYTE